MTTEEKIQQKIEWLGVRINLTKYEEELIHFQMNELVKETYKVLTIPVVVKSLPTEQCVRDWWKEDGDDDFWKNETEWKNEEVFKEIYKALTYFIKTWQ